MVHYLRCDGEYRIFTLQYWSEDEHKWADAGLDHFGHPEGFTASGECWQRTGVHGTFDEEEAIAGAAQLQKRHGIPFRVAILEISQRRYALSRKTEIDRNGRLVDLKRKLRTPVRAWIECDADSLLEELRKAVRGNVPVSEIVRRLTVTEVPQMVSELASVCEVQES